MSSIATVCFDADDTLWHNLIHFDAAERRFGDMMAEFILPSEGSRELALAETRNIAVYGFGVKSFTLSMIETAIAVSDGKVNSRMIRKLIEMGRDMLEHDIELLPHAEEALRALHGSYRLLLVTKGDLHHQERKVLASGLAHYFEGVEIVSDKNSATYQRLCNRHGIKVESSLMAGNSVRSDILPMIEAGGHGVYVPFDIIWDHEHEHVPVGTPRYHQIAHLGELPGLIELL